MSKKIFAISGIVFFVALSTLIIYKVFLSGSEEEGTNIGGFTEENDSKTDEGNRDDAKLTKIVDRNVKGATTVAGLAQVIYYDNQKFLSASFEGKVRDSLGAYPFVKVLDVQWHPAKEKALINDNGSYYLYFLDDNSADAFKENVDVATWDAYGDRIVYKRFDTSSGKRKIEIAKRPGKEVQVLVEDVPFKKVDFAIAPKGDKICYFPTPDSALEGALSCIDVESKEQLELHKGRYGADYLWSPDGGKILVSFTQEKAGNRLVLGVMSSKGGEFRGLNFTSSVKKCVWAKDNKHVFCGAMNGLPGHAVMPNDWEDKKFASSDTFWKINTNNGKQIRLVDLEQMPGHLDGAEYFLDERESSLFFTDRKTGNLYRIKL